MKSIFKSKLALFLKPDGLQKLRTTLKKLDECGITELKLYPHTLNYKVKSSESRVCKSWHNEIREIGRSSNVFDAHQVITLLDESKIIMAFIDKRVYYHYPQTGIVIINYLIQYWPQIGIQTTSRSEISTSFQVEPIRRRLVIDLARSSIYVKI